MVTQAEVSKIKSSDEVMFLTVAEAASKCGVSINTMRKMCQLKGFPKLTLGGKFYIPVHALERWVDEESYKS